MRKLRKPCPVEKIVFARTEHEQSPQKWEGRAGMYNKENIKEADEIFERILTEMEQQGKKAGRQHILIFR